MTAVTIASIRGFAGPLTGVDSELRDAVVTAHAQATVAAFRWCFADQIAEHDGALEAIDAWLSDGTTFDTAWDPAFGSIAAAVARAANGAPREDEDVDALTAALLLRLAECGRRVGAALAFRAPTAVRFGRWILPPSTAIAIDATPGTLRILTHTPHGSFVHAFDRAGDAWDAVTFAHTPLPVVEGTDWIVWTPALAASLDDAGLRAGATLASPGPLLAGAAAAIALIDALGDAHAGWVRAVVRHIVPLQPVAHAFPAGAGHLGSDPGVVGLANHDRPLELADALVHAASRAHVAIARRLDPLVDGSDPAIESALASYHALANVALFCRAAARSDRDEPYLVFRLAHVTSELQRLEATLRRSSAVTPAGLALIEPLLASDHSTV
jgi:HEXXH motif-containing protein